MRHCRNIYTMTTVILVAVALVGCVSTPTPLQSSEGIAWCIGPPPADLLGKEVSFVVKNGLKVPIYFDLLLHKAEIGSPLPGTHVLEPDNMPSSYLQPGQECTVSILACGGFLNYPRMLIYRHLTDDERKAVDKLLLRMPTIQLMKEDGFISLDRSDLTRAGNIERVVIRRVLGGDIHYHSRDERPAD